MSPPKVTALGGGHGLSASLQALRQITDELVAVVTVAEHQPAVLAEDVIGIFVVLSGFALMAWLLSRLGT